MSTCPGRHDGLRGPGGVRSKQAGSLRTWAARAGLETRTPPHAAIQLDTAALRVRRGRPIARAVSSCGRGNGRRPWRMLRRWIGGRAHDGCSGGVSHHPSWRRPAVPRRAASTSARSPTMSSEASWSAVHRLSRWRGRAGFPPYLHRRPATDAFPCEIASRAGLARRHAHRGGGTGFSKVVGEPFSTADEASCAGRRTATLAQRCPALQRPCVSRAARTAPSTRARIVIDDERRDFRLRMLRAVLDQVRDARRQIYRPSSAPAKCAA